ncbi:MAG: hypothetical protein Q4C04_01240 [Clostridia bacterium]|nr:hypothetical protein [Clostridia bacterium]
MEEYSNEKARVFIRDCFIKQGDFSILSGDSFERMLDRVMELDEEYMSENGIDEGAVYDDDAAFDHMFEKMQEAFPEEKMYCMRFVEDYMDYNERYLDSIGALEWE